MGKQLAFRDLIIFENDDLFIVNKPPMLATLDERTGTGSSLLRLLKADWPDAQICHRLDKETSGAVVIAKNPETYRHISIQFEKRKVDKLYHAIIQGIHHFEEKQVDLPILNLGKANVAIDRKEGKKAVTIFQSITYFKGYTLVACKPITGRMHQIRIHLASQKAVIAGDEMYGGSFPYLSEIKKGYRESSKEEEQPMIRRFALHARQIRFLGMNGEEIMVEAPYPKDFAVFLKMLEKFNS